jgi:hypothetical protein
MKLLLVENEKDKFGIAGSANLNVNPRYESGFIFSGSEQYDYFRTGFDDIFENDSISFGWN